MLTLTNLRAGYGKTTIIHDVSLTINPGDAIGLVGPNGCGKSTILKAIMQQANVQGGSIHRLDKNSKNLSTYEIARQGICFIHQGVNVFPSLTIRENLIMGAYSEAKRVIQERMDHLLVQFPMLANKIDHKAGGLSGGQKQLLALAIGLMNKPQLMLIDEPSIGVDPKTLEQIQHVLEWVRAQGTALVVVDHHIEFLKPIVQEIIVLNAGHIVHRSSPDAITAALLSKLYFG